MPVLKPVMRSTRKHGWMERMLCMRVMEDVQAFHPALAVVRRVHVMNKDGRHTGTRTAPTTEPGGNVFESQRW